MPLFGRRRNHDTSTAFGSHHGRQRSGIFHRKDRDRVAGGYRAALANPNTTRGGRRHAKHELHVMGQSSHVPLLTKIKRTLGIRSTPRRHNNRRTVF